MSGSNHNNPDRSCWNCYFYDGETVANGLHAICHEDHPHIAVIAMPDNACAFYRATPGPGEPKPLTRGQRLNPAPSAASSD